MTNDLEQDMIDLMAEISALEISSRVLQMDAYWIDYGDWNTLELAMRKGGHYEWMNHA
jgi:hypothetical protein